MQRAPGAASRRAPVMPRAVLRPAPRRAARQPPQGAEEPPESRQLPPRGGAVRPFAIADGILARMVCMQPASVVADWVFGYGSLIWNPEIDYEHAEVARVHGYH
ncbi:MAG TPA: gamma-glutamylcyclotransferase, partial [Zeimonas sp.]|nr:gamma-glutamylcyclotransferase [Zeimonas sp.]